VRARLFLAAALFAAVLAVAWWATRAKRNTPSSEPEYRGKPLSYWLFGAPLSRIDAAVSRYVDWRRWVYGRSWRIKSCIMSLPIRELDSRSKHPVGQIGTNAIPFLVRYLQSTNGLDLRLALKQAN
jgi:hypothetical protein